MTCISITLSCSEWLASRLHLAEVDWRYTAFDSNNVHALLSELKCMINSNEAYVNDSLESKPNQVADSSEACTERRFSDCLWCLWIVNKHIWG